MPGLAPHHLRVLTRLMDDLVPPDGTSPGAGGAGGAHYVDALLGAFDHDPPRIWAGGPFSGRHGGEADFADFLELSPWEALAWRVRIEGTDGDADLERLGPSTGWRRRYAEGLDALGADYPDLDDPAREALRASCDPAFVEMVFEHACESLYGDPVYGGNHDGIAWRAIGFRGDSQPAGYTDDEVRAPTAEGSP